MGASIRVWHPDRKPRRGRPDPAEHTGGPGDRRGATLRLDTPAGAIDAEAVIVCVPTPVLASEALMFDPPLPAKRDAAAALPLGLADKVFLRVDDPPWAAHAHLIGNPHRTCTAGHRLSPFG